MKWGLSVLDFQQHAIDENHKHPTGVFVAECGHLLMMTTPLRDEPGGAPCETCAGLQYFHAARAAPTDTGCVTGKLGYATEAEARDALLSTRIAAALGTSGRRREQRCYVCPNCGHWHLTSSGRP